MIFYVHSCNWTSIYWIIREIVFCLWSLCWRPRWPIYKCMGGQLCGVAVGWSCYYCKSVYSYQNVAWPDKCLQSWYAIYYQNITWSSSNNIVSIYGMVINITLSLSSTWTEARNDWFWDRSVKLRYICKGGREVNWAWENEIERERSQGYSVGHWDCEWWVCGLSSFASYKEGLRYKVQNSFYLDTNYCFKSPKTS